MALLPNAHTRPFARALRLQSEMVNWLKVCKEKQAANSSKGHGHASTKMLPLLTPDTDWPTMLRAEGIESHWRYTGQDTCGQGGTISTLSLNTFIPSVLTYLESILENLSVQHSSRIICPMTQEHVFCNITVIQTEMYNALQEIDVFGGSMIKPLKIRK